MPGLTIATDGRPANATARPTTAGASTTSSRPPSPSRPPVSPITPTFAPAQLPSENTADPAAASHSAIPDFARGRPTFTHTTQADQVAMAPPPTQPIDFDSNPDVLALKSAISILQLQRSRATADIQALSRARDAALADPKRFAADLAAGKVRVEGDPLFPGARATTAQAESDSDSDPDSDSSGESDTKQEETPESEPKGDADGDTPMTNGAGADASSSSKPSTKPKRKTKRKSTTTNTAGNPAPPWQKLPKPQSVVRCPPINWAQYGVVGESLDKLHAEQVAAPTPGAPMVLGQGGTYEFKSGADQGSASPAAGGEQPRRLVGVAAPYNPLRDKLEKKGKGGKR